MQKMQNSESRNLVLFHKLLFLSPNGGQRRFSRRVMRKNDNVEDGRRLDRSASGPAKSDRGQFVDVIDENASRVGARIGWVVEWQAGGYLQFFH